MRSNRAARQILMVLAIVAGVQDDTARAARLVGVDERRDRLVEIDTATGSVDTVVAGDDVRADRIVWSPDESFAYLLAEQRDEVLVFDPAAGRIVERIRVEAPTHLVFHPTEPRAYVQGCGVVVLDTTNHQIVESFPAWPFGFLILSRSGRWLYGINSGSVWVRDLWLSVSYESSFWEMDPTWGGANIGGAGTAFSSDNLVLAAEQAVWTFDPESRELRRFPYRGAGMAFAMAPESDVAVIVTHRDLARIDLTNGATEVRPIDQLSVACCTWNYGDRVAFSDDRSTVILFQGDRLEARDTATLEVVWEVVVPDSDHGVLAATDTDVLLYPSRWRWNGRFDQAGVLVRSGGVTTELGGAHWPDAAWRNVDRSFYALGDNGLERIDSVSSARTATLVDLRLGDIALARDNAFAVTRGDQALRAFDLIGGEPPRALAELDPWHADVAPLAVDPTGERLYVASELGLGVYDVMTGDVLEQLAPDEIGMVQWGRISSLTALAGDVAVLGFGDDTGEGAIVAVVDVAARAVVSEHRLATFSRRVWVVREASGEVALAAAGEDGWAWAEEAAVMRVSRAGVLQEWNEPATGSVVALAAGGTEGVAFVATANAQIGIPPALRVVDVAAGKVIAVHQLGGPVKAMTSDASTVYAAIDAEPALLLFDARSGAPLGGLSVDVHLAQLEVANGDAHGDLLDARLPSPLPPPGMIVAASGESADVTVWFGDQRFTWVVPGASYDEKVAFGAEGVLYAGSRRDGDGALVVLEPLTGRLVAEIALDGAPGNILPTPDGELVFVETRFDSGSGLSVIEAATNRVIHELRPRGAWTDPVITPDGAFVVARADGGLAVVDTRSAGVVNYLFDVPIDAVAATSAGVHFVSDDGRLYRVSLGTGVAEASAPLAGGDRNTALVGGSETLLVYIDRDCSHEIVSFDAFTGERLGVLASGDAVRFSNLAVLGDYAMSGSTSPIHVWDLRDGRLVSHLVRPEGFDRSNSAQSIAVACFEDCPPLPLAPERVRWDLLPSATPTSTPTPSATPTPDPDPPIEQSGVWLEVDAAVGVAGEVVDITIHRNSQYRADLDVQGFQLDLWLPEGVRPQEWRRGEPDCGIVGDRKDDANPPYRGASMFLPEGCDPAVDCRGVRVLVTARSRLESWPWFLCRARIDHGLAPGSYPMTVDNLYLATEPQSERLQAVVGDVHVLADRRASTPTPDRDLDYYGPTPAAIPQLLLHGRGVETTAGWTNVVEFVLSGGALAPVRGDLRAILEMEHPLRPAPNGAGGVRCQRNPELSNGGNFELLPSGCAATGDCTGVAAWVKIDAGFTGFDSGDPPRWYFRPDAWLFRCEIGVDADAEHGQYYLRLSEATFEEQAVITRDVLIDAFVPRFTPTASSTPTATSPETWTPTPSPRLTPRPCVAENGTALVCIDDLEADAGDDVELTVRYLSGGLAQAAVAFEIDLGEAFAPVGEPIDSIGRESGRCRVNPAIDKNASAFVYRGNQIKALILALDNVDPLPADARLLTCTLDVDADAAPGEYAIAVLEQQASDPDGNESPLDVRYGFLSVRGTIVPTATHTPAPETPTATRESTPTRQANARDLEPARSDSGCQVNEPRSGGWAVAIALLSMFALRLRRRNAT